MQELKELKKEKKLSITEFERLFKDAMREHGEYALVKLGVGNTSVGAISIFADQYDIEDDEIILHYHGYLITMLDLKYVTTVS